MNTYFNQAIGHETCPKRLGPKEWQNAFRYTQNEYISDVEFIECELHGSLTTYGTPENRSCARNVRATNCRAAAWYGNGTIFDEVVVDGIRTNRGPVILFACAFKHVIVKGICTSFLFNRKICHEDNERNEAFIAANEKFYRNVDWALDISQIKGSRFELRGCVPVELIRRNPSEHFIMTREVALSGEWTNYQPMDWFKGSIESFLESHATAELFVAPRRLKMFKEELGFYLRLKEAGLVH